MNITEIFFLFLKKELTPNERKAFINSLKRYAYLNRGCGLYFKKNLIADIVSYGLETSFDSYCSSLSSLMRGILYNFHDILGNAKMKNPLIESMHYDCGELGYRNYHIKYYCDKWRDFLRNNVKNWERLFYFSNVLNQNYALTTKNNGQDSSL